MKTRILTAIFTAALAGTAGAQQMSLGEFEYANSCVQCHGADAKGSGPVTPLLTTRPPDLTVLQKDNGGVFPVSSIYSIIEGTTPAAFHGGDMPLWGNRYRLRAEGNADYAFSPEERDQYVRTRILALIEYLSKLQVQ